MWLHNRSRLGFVAGCAFALLGAIHDVRAAVLGYTAKAVGGDTILTSVVVGRGGHTVAFDAMAGPFCLVRPRSANTTRNQPRTGHFKPATVNWRGEAATKVAVAFSRRYENSRTVREF